MTGIRNARIERTMLGVEDHGIMSAWVYLDYGGAGQGFGGYTLDAVPAARGLGASRRPHRACGLFVARVLQVVGASSWEKLPGCYCRADVQQGLVRRLGHALRDEWFDPAEEMTALQETAS